MEPTFAAATEKVKEVTTAGKELEDDDSPPHRSLRKKSSKEIVIPVVEDDVDLETVREYISQMKEKNQVEKLSSNKATNGSKLADFDSEGIGERDESEIIPVHAHETKEKMLEEFKRRLEISETKYLLSKDAADANDLEKGLLYATEASSILYEQFIGGCRKLDEEKHKEILKQKIKCMMMIVRIQYKQGNYKESIRELNMVLFLREIFKEMINERRPL